MTTGLQRVHKQIIWLFSVAGPSVWKPISVVDTVALAQVISPSAAVFPCQCHSTKAPHSFPSTRAPSLTSSVVGRQIARSTNTPAGLGNANCDGTRQNAPRLLALQREERLMAKSKRGEGGTVSRGVNSVCLCLHFLTPAARPVRRHWTTWTAASPETDWARVRMHLSARTVSAGSNRRV